MKFQIPSLYLLLLSSPRAMPFRVTQFMPTFRGSFIIFSISWFFLLAWAVYENTLSCLPSKYLQNVWNASVISKYFVNKWITQNLLFVSLVENRVTNHSHLPRTERFPGTVLGTFGTKFRKSQANWGKVFMLGGGDSFLLFFWF